MIPQKRGKPGGIQRVRHPCEGVEIPAFTAEAEDADAAEGVEERNRAEGKVLRGRKRPGKGQFQYQIHPSRERGPDPVGFGKQGGSPRWTKEPLITAAIWWLRRRPRCVYGQSDKRGRCEMDCIPRQYPLFS